MKMFHFINYYDCLELGVNTFLTIILISFEKEQTHYLSNVVQIIMTMVVQIMMPIKFSKQKS